MKSYSFNIFHLVVPPALALLLTVSLIYSKAGHSNQITSAAPKIVTAAYTTCSGNWCHIFLWHWHSVVAVQSTRDGSPAILICRAPSVKGCCHTLILQGLTASNSMTGALHTSLFGGLCAWDKPSVSHFLTESPPTPTPRREAISALQNWVIKYNRKQKRGGRLKRQQGKNGKGKGCL